MSFYNRDHVQIHTELFVELLPSFMFLFPLLIMAAETVQVASQPINTAQTEARKWAQTYLNARLNTKSEGPSKPFNVPIIEISSTFSGSLEDKQVVAAQIRDACTNSGYAFPYVIPSRARRVPFYENVAMYHRN